MSKGLFIVDPGKVWLKGDSALNCLKDIHTDGFKSGVKNGIITLIAYQLLVGVGFVIGREMAKRKMEAKK